jgi:hypothetical protein
MEVVMSDEHSEMEPEAAPGGKAGKSKEKRQRAPRTHGDRALASLRAANRAQREITEPAERLRPTSWRCSTSPTRSAAATARRTRRPRRRPRRSRQQPVIDGDRAERRGGT